MSTLSVIIPAYQHAATLPACLDSLFAQTRLPDEVIVVNDGSTDDTEAALAPYLDRIRYLAQENQGGNAARNAGYAVSSGDLVLFCDADIVLRSDMLQRLEAALETHPEASYAYSGFRFGWKGFPSFPFDPERLRAMNYIHTSALIRRADFPGFDPTVRRFQDWDVWLTMLARGKTGVHVPEELFQVLEGKGRTGISQWRPSFLYRIPWTTFGFTPSSVRRYQDARNLIIQKHHL